MNLDQFRQRLNSEKPLVTYFSHDACTVCKVLRPRVRALADSVPGVDFLYINTQEEPEIAGQFMVFTVPTIIIFDRGKEAKRFSRHINLQELRQLLERIVL